METRAKPVWLRAKVYNVLREALRRFECFGVRRDGRRWTLEDMQKAWTGFGTIATYRAAVVEGYMTHAHPANEPYTEWWCLTPKGARIVMAWHHAGHNCGKGFDLTSEPSPTASMSVQQRCP